MNENVFIQKAPLDHIRPPPIKTKQNKKQKNTSLVVRCWLTLTFLPLWKHRALENNHRTPARIQRSFTAPTVFHCGAALGLRAPGTLMKSVLGCWDAAQYAVSCRLVIQRKKNYIPKKAYLVRKNCKENGGAAVTWPSSS